MFFTAEDAEGRGGKQIQGEGAVPLKAAKANLPQSTRRYAEGTGVLGESVVPVKTVIFTTEITEDTEEG